MRGVRTASIQRQILRALDLMQVLQEKAPMADWVHLRNVFRRRVQPPLEANGTGEFVLTNDGLVGGTLARHLSGMMTAATLDVMIGKYFATYCLRQWKVAYMYGNHNAARIIIRHDKTEREDYFKRASPLQRSVLVQCDWELVRRAVRVRPYALHWLETHAIVSCADGGKNRARDLLAFEEALDLTRHQAQQTTGKF